MFEEESKCRCTEAYFTPLGCSGTKLIPATTLQPNSPELGCVRAGNCHKSPGAPLSTALRRLMAADTGAANSEDFCGGAGKAMCEEFVIKSYTGTIIKCWKEAEVLFHNIDTLRSVLW